IPTTPIPAYQTPVIANSPTQRIYLIILLNIHNVTFYLTMIPSFGILLIVTGDDPVSTVMLGL
ncbi:MAG TPA: hypothetical protein PK200_18065, partial [Spirochaetota bacterium]|nr:hypothetical protein [Spirochaetota bacterium]